MTGAEEHAGDELPDDVDQWSLSELDEVSRDDAHPRNQEAREAEARLTKPLRDSVAKFARITQPVDTANLITAAVARSMQPTLNLIGESAMKEFSQWLQSDSGPSNKPSAPAPKEVSELRVGEVREVASDVQVDLLTTLVDMQAKQLEVQTSHRDEARLHAKRPRREQIRDWATMVASVVAAVAATVTVTVTRS